MEKKYKNNLSRYFQSGLTLIELLVSMLIASIVFGGVVAVVQTSRTNYTSETESALMQESTRFAVELISRDIRMAGNLGCAKLESVALANLLNGDLGDLIDTEESLGISGYESSDSNPAFPYAVTALVGEDSQSDLSDVIILRYADTDPRKLEQVSHDEASSSFRPVNGGSHNFKVGDKVVVVDANCRHAAIFQTTNITGGIGYAGSGSGLPGNCSAHITHIFSNDSFSCETAQNKSGSSGYGGGSMLYPYMAHAYFVDESSIVPGMPALKRVIMNSGGARSEELAQGVENLNFEYGINDDQGNVRFYTASEIRDSDDPNIRWKDVVSVKFRMILRSQTEALQEPKEIILDGINFNDRYLRQLVSGTIALRNL